jgi:ELKS/RAB6-interacting/CAST family protein 1
MQSIKQFWSPELKRERQQRKEETAKYTVLLEQYKLLQSQYQTLLETYEQQSIQLQQTQIQMQQLHQHEDLSLNNSASAKQALKEKTLLKKTISELEMRINAQKQSLNTKDETIKKLFQMIKTISNKNNDLSSSVNNKIDTVRIRIFHVLFSISLCLI